MYFANPLGLLFASLYAVLIALHLWERIRHRIDVPSLMLWEVVPEDAIRSGRPHFDLLFALQLILLTLLIGALAKPYVTIGTGEAAPIRHVFVLDISASMKVREGQTTRFQMALQALRERLQQLGDKDEAMLITAAERPRVVNRFTRNRTHLLRRLEKIEPVDTGTNLDLALAVANSAAARSDRTTIIEVFTDTRSSRPEKRSYAETRFVRFGESDANVALQSLQILQPRFQDHRDARATAIVRNFSHRDFHAFLTVDVQGEVVTRDGFSLGPRADRTFVIAGFPRPGVVRALLEVEDALPSDNVAHAWLRPSRSVEVLVVSRQSSITPELEQLARVIPNLRFHFLHERHYTPGIEGNADVVLLHGFVPETEPVRASLYVNPPSGAHLFKVLGDAEEVEILDWNERHPVLRDLKPIIPNPLPHVRLIERPAWADMLLASRNEAGEIPIAFAGERGGKRVACMAFDPVDEQFLSADRVPILLFFLNLLDWLAPQESTVSVVRAGEVETLTDLPVGPRNVTDPLGRSFTVAADPGSTTLQIEALHAGPYLIAVDGTRRQVLANLFDALESDVGRPPPEPGEPAALTPGPTGVASQPTDSFAGWLLVGAAGLLLAEWLTATRRGPRRGTS